MWLKRQKTLIFDMKCTLHVENGESSSIIIIISNILTGFMAGKWLYYRAYTFLPDKLFKHKSEHYLQNQDIQLEENWTKWTWCSYKEFPG